MSFWGKVKDLIGIEDDYYEDDYYNDYDIHDNYDNTDVEDKQEYTEKQSKIEKKEEETVRPSVGYKEQSTIQSSRRSVRQNAYSSQGEMIVTIKEPLTYEDGKAVLDDIISGKTVVLNLEMLEVDKKTQIFYFVSGGLYALKGSIQNVTKDIYVLVPEGVEVDSKLKNTISDKSLYEI